MARLIYSTRATVTGGRGKGRGRTADGALDIELRPPGVRGGTNPEQLFAVGYAACFEEAAMLVGRNAGADVSDISTESKVSLFGYDDGTYGIAVALEVSLPSVEDLGKAKEIVAETHRICPYSNAVRGNVEVAITVNGAPLD